MTLANIMRMAHTLKKAFRCGMSQALRMAWAYKRGHKFACEVSFSNGVRFVGFGNSYDEVRKIANDEIKAVCFTAEGHRSSISSYGSYHTNMRVYAPAIEPVFEAMPMAA